MIFEMEEKLFAISGIRLPLDHKTGKEYIESIKIKKYDKNRSRIPN